MVRPGQHRQRMPMNNKGNHKQGGGHYSSNRPSANNHQQQVSFALAF